MLPFIGDAQAVADAKTDYEKGNYGMAAFNAATAIPVLGDIAALAKIGVPTAMGIGGIIRGMMKRSGDVPVTPFGKQAGILGGVKAKTADINQLHRAQVMTHNNIPREEIWKETGWFKGVDDKWKFEIDDSRAKPRDILKSDPNSRELLDEFGEISTDLDKAMTHTDYKKAYPDDFKHTEVISQPYAQSEGGSYNMGTITTPTDYRHGDKAFKVDKSTTLHEMQHGVQDAEGFARGGSTEMFSPKNMTREKVNDIYSQQMDLLESNPEFGNVRKEMHSMLSDIQDQYGHLVTDNKGNGRAALDWTKVPKDKYDAYMALQKKAREFPEFDKYSALDFKKSIIETSDNTLTPYDQYRALAGEAESRAVQSRMSLTPQQRIDRPFWLDYDVPESEQIIKFK